MTIDIPGNVRTDQANTYTTGAQSFAGATSLTVPTAAGAAPTADGDVRYDSTQDAVAAGGAGGLTGLIPRILKLSSSTTDTLDSASITTTETAFTQAFTVPGNFLINKKGLRVTALLQHTTGSAPPTIVYRLRLGGVGGTVVWSFAAVSPVASVTDKGTSLSFVIVGTAAPGSSVNVISGLATGATGASIGVPTNQTAQPVAIATDSSQSLVFTIQYSGAGTGTTTEKLLALMVEEVTGP